MEKKETILKMRMFVTTTLLSLGLVASLAAQVPVQASPDQSALLSSPDPQLAANKKLVYDMWRSFLEAGHLELADQYFDEGYIQHNPNIPTGRAALVEGFSKFAKKTEIKPQIQGPLVDIVAEGNLVVLSFVRTEKDPKDPSKTYTSTWFDMFRVQNGKIMEHWDTALKF